MTEKGQRPARAAKAVLGKYRLETAQEEQHKAGKTVTEKNGNDTGTTDD